MRVEIEEAVDLKFVLVIITIIKESVKTAEAVKITSYNL